MVFFFTGQNTCFSGFDPGTCLPGAVESTSKSKIYIIDNVKDIEEINKSRKGGTLVKYVQITLSDQVHLMLKKKCVEEKVTMIQKLQQIIESQLEKKENKNA
jgi:hypothetical protein